MKLCRYGSPPYRIGLSRSGITTCQRRFLCPANAQELSGVGLVSDAAPLIGAASCYFAVLKAHSEVELGADNLLSLMGS